MRPGHVRALAPAQAAGGGERHGRSPAAIATLLIRLGRTDTEPWLGRKVATVRKKLANPSPSLNGTKRLHLALRLL
jgi:hypothetical protein